MQILKQSQSADVGSTHDRDHKIYADIVRVVEDTLLPYLTSCVSAGARLMHLDNFLASITHSVLCLDRLQYRRNLDFSMNVLGVSEDVLFLSF